MGTPHAAESESPKAKHKLSGHQPNVPVNKQKEMVFRSFAALIICAVSIGCFNICLPYMATAQRAWSATTFGVVDGCAGAGAFLALLAMGDRSVADKLTMVAPLVFLVAGMLLGVTRDASIACICAVLWGTALNIMRTRARSIFFAIAQNVTQATRWASRLVLSRVIAEAMAPLVAGLLLDTLTPSKSYLIMMGACSATMVALGAGLYFRQQPIRSGDKRLVAS